jgi:hypothetical protein
MRQINGKKVRLSLLEADMMRTFEAGTKELIAERDMLRGAGNDLMVELLGQEIDLRERRLRQWKDNPSGEPEDPFGTLTEYRRI